MPDRFFLDLLGTALPLVVGGFLAGLFTYWFERRRIRLERAERRAVLLESLRRELAFVPEQLPDYWAGAVHLMPPIRTVVGGQLLDGQVLDWRSDALLIQPLLEFLGIAAIYNDLVGAVNAGQAWPEDVRQHWHGQLLGVHTSVLSTQRTLLSRLTSTPAARIAALAPKRGLDPAGPTRLDAPGLASRSRADRSPATKGQASWSGAHHSAAETSERSDAGTGVPGLATAAPGDAWRVDLAHSRVGFSARHMGIITVHGQFTAATVQLNLDPRDLTRSTVAARIEANSVRTGDDRRDADLRSAHFLDADVFPTIVFASTAIERLAADRFRVDGELTIRDVTRSISLELVGTAPVSDGRGGLRRGFTATGQIDRTAWGLNWNMALETGGWLVSEEVQLELEVAVFGPAGDTKKS